MTTAPAPELIPRNLFLLFAALLVEQGFGLSHSSIPLLWTS